MTLTDVLVGLAILVGMAGIIVPVLPGTVLILVALLAWAVVVAAPAAWVVFAVAAVVLATGQVVKYLVPHRRLQEAGVPSSTLVWGAAAAVVGFFVVPYVGLLVGFVVGIYAAERRRVGAAAWPSTKHALKAVGVSVLVELAAAVLAVLVWTLGLVLT